MKNKRADNKLTPQGQDVFVTIFEAISSEYNRILSDAPEHIREIASEHEDIADHLSGIEYDIDIIANDLEQIS